MKLFSFHVPCPLKIDKDGTTSSSEKEGSQQLVSEDVRGEGTTDVSFEELPDYFKHVTLAQDSGAIVERDNSLRITVECHDLESLERLWSDYCSGHLNSIAEKCLLTDDIKRRFHVESVNLETIVLEDDYLACKEYLLKKTRKLAIIYSFKVVLRPKCL